MGAGDGSVLMSLGRFWRGAWPFVTPAVDSQGKWKVRKFCPSDSAGMTEKERAFPLKQECGDV